MDNASFSIAPHARRAESAWVVGQFFGFEKEADALQRIKEKSQGWLVENSKARR